MRIVRCLLSALLIVGVSACGSGGGDDAGSSSGAAQSSDAAQPTGDEQSATSGSASSGPAPVAGQSALPATGMCWRMSEMQLDEGAGLTSTDQAPVDCSASHNAITIGVVGIQPGLESTVGALAQSGEVITPDQTEQWHASVVSACDAAYDEAFASGKVEVNPKWAKAGYRATMLSRYVWLPTAEEWLGGARWIRCDVASRAGVPLAMEKPELSLGTVPDELASCLNANSEGFLYVPCDDPMVNAQALVTLVLDDNQTTNAKSAYEDYQSLASMICQDAVKVAYPKVTAEAKPALPIAQAFTGRYDCYVDHAAGEPLIK